VKIDSVDFTIECNKYKFLDVIGQGAYGTVAAV
jgi:hypothetical protein